MSELEIRIGHLYPEHTDQFGDRGNVLALYRRACWHGLKPTLIPMGKDEKIDFNRIDILVMGSLPRSEQESVVADLNKRVSEFKTAVDRGLVVLAIGGSYQILGKHYPAEQGNKLTGLGILNLHTEPSPSRFTGNAVISCPLWDPPRSLVGFENHSGLTFLGSPVKALGKVIEGRGNNGRDRTEGAVYKNVVGSYLHGALLPKNPWLTDHLLAKAMAYRQRIFKPTSLDDGFETQAHREAVRLASRRRR